MQPSGGLHVVHLLDVMPSGAGQVEPFDLASPRANGDQSGSAIRPDSLR
jgi:hypothetical protein